MKQRGKVGKTANGQRASGGRLFFPVATGRVRFPDLERYDLAWTGLSLPGLLVLIPWHPSSRTPVAAWSSVLRCCPSRAWLRRATQMTSLTMTSDIAVGDGTLRSGRAHACWREKECLCAALDDRTRDTLPALCALSLAASRFCVFFLLRCVWPMGSLPSRARFFWPLLLPLIFLSLGTSSLRPSERHFCVLLTTFGCLPPP